MKCNTCKKKEAVVHYAEIVNGQMKKMDLCESCAVEKGVGKSVSVSMTDLLTGITDWEPTKDVKDQEVCPTCKMTYTDFKKTGRLGCSECYKTFSRSLTPLLETIHHSSKHSGKLPVKNKKVGHYFEKIRKLNNELQEAVVNEEFEKAAMLRDEIRRIDLEKKETRRKR